MTEADASAVLVVPNLPSALRPMSEWLQARLAELDASREARFAFDLCANEALANVIEHGDREPGRHEIALRLWRCGGEIVLEIEDDGRPFDPVAQPAPLRPGSLEDAPIGGLGLVLIRHHMDRCEHEHRDGRNLLRLVRRSEPPRP